MTAKGSQDNLYNHVLLTCVILVGEVLKRLVVRREKALIQRFSEKLASTGEGDYQVRAEFHRKWLRHIRRTIDAKELLRFDREVKHVQLWIFGQNWPNLL